MRQTPHVMDAVVRRKGFSIIVGSQNTTWARRTGSFNFLTAEFTKVNLLIVEISNVI